MNHDDENFKSDKELNRGPLNLVARFLTIYINQSADNIIQQNMLYAAYSLFYEIKYIFITLAEQLCFC